MIAAKRSLAALAGCSLALAGAVFVPARARSTSASTRSHTGPVVAVNANQSNNWSGYNQGKIERSTAFHAVAGDWIVPTASPHRPFESEFSSSWIGIGGGCVDAGCSQTDNTLIQTGTEQEVDYDPANGTSTQYSAWYEHIPDPATPRQCRWSTSSSTPRPRLPPPTPRPTASTTAPTPGAAPPPPPPWPRRPSRHPRAARGAPAPAGARSAARWGRSGPRPRSPWPWVWPRRAALPAPVTGAGR